MAYCTLDDIRGHIPEARLVEVTADASATLGGTVVESVVDKAIGEATATIDSYIATRFKLPLSAVPDVLKKVAVDLSIYALYERVSDMEIPDGMTARRKNSIATLEGLADGSLNIGLAVADEGNRYPMQMHRVGGGPSFFNLDEFP